MQGASVTASGVSVIGQQATVGMSVMGEKTISAMGSAHHWTLQKLGRADHIEEDAEFTQLLQRMDQAEKDARQIVYRVDAMLNAQRAFLKARQALAQDLTVTTRGPIGSKLGAPSPFGQTASKTGAGLVQVNDLETNLVQQLEELTSKPIRDLLEVGFGALKIEMGEYKLHKACYEQEKAARRISINNPKSGHMSLDGITDTVTQAEDSKNKYLQSKDAIKERTKNIDSKWNNDIKLNLEKFTEVQVAFYGKVGSALTVSPISQLETLSIARVVDDSEL